VGNPLCGFFSGGGSNPDLTVIFPDIDFLIYLYLATFFETSFNSGVKSGISQLCMHVDIKHLCMPERPRGGGLHMLRCRPT
jgi:hypothetical protein